ncbi:MAG TPA: CBS domain-containing protein [Actinomycetota bacterium]|jgi:CBS-domain-containing membrane protein|nr:CBS domain-containing protein [Actinomycetota bacterium]
MTSEVVTIGEQTGFKEIAAVMAEHRISALPVLDPEGRVTGIVSEADLLLKEELPEGRARRRLFQGRRHRVQRAKAAGATAAELMTAPAVTVGPDASVTEAARLLHRHGIKRLPVVDPAGPLLGIVSRADLLKVFLRADPEIAQEIRQEVLRRAMWVDPDLVTVQVRDGVVTLTGQLERRSLIPIVVSLVRGLDGVVDVVDRLTFELDDSPIMVPSDLLISRAPGVRRWI